MEWLLRLNNKIFLFKSCYLFIACFLKYFFDICLINISFYIFLLFLLSFLPLICVELNVTSKKNHTRHVCIVCTSDITKWEHKTSLTIYSHFLIYFYFYIFFVNFSQIYKSKLSKTHSVKFIEYFFNQGSWFSISIYLSILSLVIFEWNRNKNLYWATC